MSLEHPAENESMRCASCGVELPSESAYCSTCGAPTSVEPHHCASCGVEMPPQSAYCSTCGARNERRVRYSLWRVGILTLISFGLYYLYWMGVSWKHLAAEIPEKKFHPFWHAMSQFVPIYNFIVVYQHFRTIKEVQGRARVESNLVPGLAVVLSVVVTFIAINAYLLLPDRAGAFWVMLIIAIIGEGILVIWGQRNLNKYRERPGARPVRSAGTGPGEIITVVGGIVTALVVVLISITFLMGLSTLSTVDEADSLTMIEIYSEVHGGTIDNYTEADAYRFGVWGGAAYTVSVIPILPWGSDDDPLEAAIVILWDSDGTTVLHQKSGATPIVIPWTTSSSGGTRYVTIESDQFARGDYVLSVNER